MSENQQVQQENNYASANVKIKPKEIFCYASGAFADNICWGMIMSFMMFFWTDMLFIPAGVAGTFMLITKLWDAVNDPIIGTIADRNCSKKHGQYRPWLLAGIPMLLLNALCFLKLPGASLNLQMVYSFVVYFLFILAFTAFDIPQTSLMSKMTLNAQSRGSLGSWRMILGFFSNMILTACFTSLAATAGQGDMAKGYFIGALVFNLLMLPFVYINYRGCKERVPFTPQEAVSVRESLKSLKNNRPVICLFLAFLSWGMAGGINSSARMYYWTYYVGNQGGFPLNITLYILGMLIGAFLCNAMIARVSNKRTVTLILWVGALIACFVNFFLPIHTPSGLFAFQALTFAFGVCGGGGFTALYGMVPDITEYTQLKYGNRSGAFLFAFVNFGSKFGIAFLTALFGWVMGGLGYAPGAVQSDTVLFTMNLFLNTIAGLVLLLGIIALLFYNLDKKTHASIVEALERQHDA